MIKSSSSVVSFAKQSPVRILRTTANSIHFPGALKLVDNVKIRLATNQEIVNILRDTELTKTYEPLFPSWSGTIVIYNPPDVEFGKVVTHCKNLQFHVPTQFQGLRNHILMIDPPNYTIDWKERQGQAPLLTLNVADINMIKVFNGFPLRPGYYNVNSEIGLPYGVDRGQQNFGSWQSLTIGNGEINHAIEHNPLVCKFWGRRREEFIGPLVWGIMDWHGQKFTVMAYKHFSERFGVPVIHMEEVTTHHH